MTERTWVSFDSNADALTVVFRAVRPARTVEESYGRLVDLDEAGRVVAVEVVGVSAGFGLDDLAEKYGFEAELREVEGSLPSQFYRQFA
jgi:hypothetical protein